MGVSLVVTSLLYNNIEEETKKEYAMPTEYEKMIAGDFISQAILSYVL